MANGEVMHVGYEENGFGNYIKILDKDSDRIIYMAHMKTPSPLKKGNKVSYTTKIGIMGSTGNSTGNHTHFEVRMTDNKTRCNPCEYMGIPNIRGTYNSSDYALNKGDVLEDMTKTEFDNIINGIKNDYNNKLDDLKAEYNVKINNLNTALSKMTAMNNTLIDEINAKQDKQAVYKTLSDIPGWGKSTVEECIRENVIVPDKDGNINISHDLLIAIMVIDRKEADFDSLDDIPEWYRPIIQKLVDMLVLKGEQGENEELRLNINTQAVKILVILDRLGLFDRKEDK